MAGRTRNDAIQNDDNLGSFEDFYQTNFSRQLKQAVLMLQSEAGAKDAVHDAFIEVWHRWKRLENPEAYLTRCVANRCRRLLRRDAIWDRNVSPDQLQLVHNAPDPMLAQAIRTLSIDHRSLLVLRYYANMPYSEIASTLGWPIGSVGPRLSDALATLRKELYD